MLKRKIAKLEDVEEQYRGLYKAVGDEFILQIDGAADDSALTAEVDRLKSHMQTLLDEKKSESEKRKSAEDEARIAAEEKARSQGDWKSLETSMKAIHDKAITDAKGETDVLRGHFDALLVDNFALQSMTGFVIEGSEALAVQLIKSRLAVDYSDGQPKTRILDGNGEITAMTIEQLKEELGKQPGWDNLIVGSRASGSGATGGGSGGGGAVKKFSELSETELVALKNDSPEQYNRLRDDHYAGHRRF